MDANEKEIIYKLSGKTIIVNFVKSIISVQENYQHQRKQTTKNKQQKSNTYKNILSLRS